MKELSSPLPPPPRILRLVKTYPSSPLCQGESIRSPRHHPGLCNCGDGGDGDGGGGGGGVVSVFFVVVV